MAWMPGLPRRDGVVDERDRIRRARVLGVAIVVQVQLARRRIDDDILEHRAEPPRRREDLRLGLGRKADRLRVAAALEVEHAAIAPPVLVVADEHAIRIARQRRLAGAREAEEQRDVARRPDVGRTMHRQHALQRQDVIQDREDRFLHLARVARPADQHELLREADRDHDVGVDAVALGIRFEARRVDHRELGRGFAGRLRIVDEQVAAEETVPRVLGDDADRQAVGGIGAGIHILHEQILTVQGPQQFRVQHVELRRLHRPVRLAPLDLAIARRFADDELVVGRAAGVRPGAARERTRGGDQAFLPAHRFFVERRRSEIPVDAIGGDPFVLQAARAVKADAHRTLLRYGGPVTYAESRDRTRRDRSSQYNAPSTEYTVNNVANTS